MFDDVEAKRKRWPKLGIYREGLLQVAGDDQRIDASRSLELNPDGVLFEPVEPFARLHGLVLAHSWESDMAEWSGGRVEHRVYLRPEVRRDYPVWDSVNVPAKRGPDLFQTDEEFALVHGLSYRDMTP